MGVFSICPSLWSSHGSVQYLSLFGEFKWECSIFVPLCGVHMVVFNICPFLGSSNGSVQYLSLFVEFIWEYSIFVPLCGVHMGVFNIYPSLGSSNVSVQYLSLFGEFTWECSVFVPLCEVHMGVLSICPSLWSSHGSVQCLSHFVEFTWECSVFVLCFGGYGVHVEVFRMWGVHKGLIRICPSLWDSHGSVQYLSEMHSRTPSSTKSMPRYVSENKKYTWAPQTVHNTPVMNILKGYYYIILSKKKNALKKPSERQILIFS